MTRARAAAIVVAAALAGACSCSRDDPSPAAESRSASAPSSRQDTRIRFTDVSAASGITLKNVNGNTGVKPTILESLGQGAATLDFDSDGLLDLFLCNGDVLLGEPANATPRCALYRQDRPFHFVDVTEHSGLGVRGWFQGAYAADIDADGHPDLFLTAFEGSRLFRNRGDGTFEDVTSAWHAGIPGWTTGAAFFDADGDGDLDLFVTRYAKLDFSHLPNEGRLCDYRGILVACGPHGLPKDTCVFLENVGDHFVDSTLKAGFSRAPASYGLGVIALDFDGDGDMDVYVANDSVANHLFENRGGGKFIDVAADLGCDLAEEGRAQSGMGVDAADLNGDGRPEIFVTNFEHDTNTLYLNRCDGRLRAFVDITAASGLGTPSFAMMGWGTRIADYDLDGLLDIVVANGHIYPQVDGSKLDTTYAQKNQYFRGRGLTPKGDPRFEQIKDAGTFFDKQSPSRGLLTADFDNDGRLDLFVMEMDALPTLGRNETVTNDHWLGVVLRGQGRNRDAIGARLVVVTDDGAVRHVERTYGGGFFSTSDPRLHVGLGAARVRTGSVHFPSGVEVSIPPALIDGYVLVDEATRTAVRRNFP